VGEVGIGTAEIEMELDLGHHGHPPSAIALPLRFKTARVQCMGSVMPSQAHTSRACAAGTGTG
jgi:hypothetical protein